MYSDPQLLEISKWRGTLFFEGRECRAVIGRHAGPFVKSGI
jgi:hypothetical protein